MTASAALISTEAAAPHTRQASGSGRFWRGFLLVSLLIGLAGWGYSHRVAPTAPLKNSAPSQGPTSLTPPSFRSQRVSALGRLEPLDRIRRIAPPSGNEGATVSRLFVSEGDAVKAGDLLATLDNLERRQALVEQALAGQTEAQSRLAQTEAGAKSADIRAAEMALKQARKQFEVSQRMFHRAELLKRNQAISEDEYDQLMWERDKATVEVERLDALLESIKEVRSIDVAWRKAEVEVQKAAVGVAQADLARSSIVAPISGKVLKVHAWPGETIGSNGLLEMGNVDQMAVVAEVYEGDAAQVTQGMEAQIRFESMPLVLHGKVEEIGYMIGRKVVLSNDPVSDTDARVLEVRILLKPEDRQVAERFSNARAEVVIDLTSLPTTSPPQASSVDDAQRPAEVSNQSPAKQPKS